jgi:hypothetical protein
MMSGREQTGVDAASKSLSHSLYVVLVGDTAKSPTYTCCLISNFTCMMKLHHEALWWTIYCMR